jgi:GT2 family glycosyltransferase
MDRRCLRVDNRRFGSLSYCRPPWSRATCGRAMRLSIVIVNWNLRDELAACLDSLRLQTHGDLEIVVVDNGSSDGSVELLDKQYPECKMLKETQNLGFAEGCNRGILACSGEWVAMLNNDVVVDPRWAAALIEAAERAPADRGMLQSLMLFKQRPDIINSTGIELGRNGGGRDRLEGQPRQAGANEAEIFCCSAGAAAYRRVMLEDLKLGSGYFDRSHFMYLEDLDLGWRARLAGWSASYVPDSVVYHRYHGSSERHGRDWLITMGRANRIRTLLKNASWMLLTKLSLRMVGASLDVLWHAKARGPGTLYRAIRTGLTTRKEVTALCTRDRREVELKWLSAR